MADSPTLTKTRMTSADYMTLPETTQPMQLIDGEIIVSPAPKDDHQKVVTNAVPVLKVLIPDGQLRVAPADLTLDEFNTPQPDLFWISSENTRCKLMDGYWHGAPDLIIEVLSPGTARVDRGRKFTIYEKHGVREYWMVDPVGQYIEVYRLEDGKFVRQGIFGPDESFVSHVLGDKTVEVAALFH